MAEMTVDKIEQPDIPGLEFKGRGSIRTIPFDNFEELAEFSAESPYLRSMPAQALKNSAIAGRAAVLLADVIGEDGEITQKAAGYQRRLKLVTDESRERISIVAEVDSSYFYVPILDEDPERAVLKSMVKDLDVDQDFALVPIDQDENASAMQLRYQGKGGNTYLKHKLDEQLKEINHRTNPVMVTGETCNLVSAHVNTENHGLKIVDPNKLRYLAAVQWYGPFPKGQGNKDWNLAPAQWATENELEEIKAKAKQNRKYEESEIDIPWVFMVDDDMYADLQNDAYQVGMDVMFMSEEDPIARLEEQFALAVRDELTADYGIRQQGKIAQEISSHIEELREYYSGDEKLYAFVLIQKIVTLQEKDPTLPKIQEP